MKILVADDDLTMQVILQSALVRLGYQVELAADGDRAWAILEGPQAPALAILDWQMPGLTGVEICRRLRQRKVAAYTYVVLLSGLDSLEDLVAGLEAGADDYMTKPFKPAELKARLHSGQRVLDLQQELLAAQAQLQVLASYDALTMLWNRRVIMERLQQELARAEREANSLGLVMVDIDHFKRVNDRLGHAAGDEILQQVATRLTEAVRPYDSVGRYGGEEFLIVATHCNLDATLTLAERARRIVCQTPMSAATESVSVTASFGVAATRAGAKPDLQALIDSADRALYYAKALGRNRVEWLARDGSDRMTRMAPGGKENR